MSLLKPISPLGPTLQPTRQLFHHLLKLKLQLLSSPHPTSNLTEKFSRSVRFLSTPCQRIHPLSTPTPALSSINPQFQSPHTAIPAEIQVFFKTSSKRSQLLQQNNSFATDLVPISIRFFALVDVWSLELCGTPEDIKEQCHDTNCFPNKLVDGENQRC